MRDIPSLRPSVAPCPLRTRARSGGLVPCMALITWANCMACADGDDAQNRENIDTKAKVALDMLTPDHAIHRELSIL